MHTLTKSLLLIQIPIPLFYKETSLVSAWTKSWTNIEKDIGNIQDARNILKNKMVTNWKPGAVTHKREH
jgi:hypothetical protein